MLPLFIHEDKKKLGEGSYGSVSKATNISTKAIRKNAHRMWFFYGRLWRVGCLPPGHPCGEDHFQSTDEEHRALQAGCYDIAEYFLGRSVRLEVVVSWCFCCWTGDQLVRRLPSWKWWTTPTSSSSMSPSRILGPADVIQMGCELPRPMQ